MDWSLDIPQAPASPLLHVPPTSEYISSPHALLHNKDPNGKNSAASVVPSVLNYGKDQPAISSSWKGTHHALSIFRTEKTIYKDSKVMFYSLERLRKYIKYNLADSGPTKRELEPIVEYLWKLIDITYTAKWDILVFNKKKNLTIRKCVEDRIIPYYRQNQHSTLTLNITMANPSPLPTAETAPPPATNILVAPPPPNKNVESTIKKDPKPSNMKKFYVQASKSNLSCIKDIVQFKEAFPALLADKVEKVLKIKNSREGNKKPRINMITRKLLRKEVIILMAKHNAELIINLAHIYIVNINKCLKNSKLDIIVDFI